MNDYTRGAIWAFSVTVLTGGVLATGIQIGRRMGTKEAAHAYLFELYKSTAHSELKRAVEFVEKVDQEAKQYSILDTQRIKDIFGVQSPSEALKDFKPEPEATVDTHKDVIFTSHDHAEKILRALQMQIAKNGNVSVNEFFDLARVEHLHDHNNDVRGWTHLRKVGIVERTSGGYWLDLPSLERFENQGPEIDFDIPFGFDDEGEALATLASLQNAITRQGNVSVAEYYNIIDSGIDPEDVANYWGWTNLDKGEVLPVPALGGFKLVLPKPYRL